MNQPECPSTDGETKHGASTHTRSEPQAVHERSHTKAHILGDSIYVECPEHKLKKESRLVVAGAKGEKTK